MVVDSATSWANVWGRRRRRGAAGLAGSEYYCELQRFGRTVTASLSSWRKHDGKQFLVGGAERWRWRRDLGGGNQQVTRNSQCSTDWPEESHLEAQPSGSRIAVCLPALLISGGPKAISRIQCRFGEAEIWGRSCCNGQRPSPAKEYRADGVHCRSSKSRRLFSVLSKGAPPTRGCLQLSRFGRNQHSERASGPKSPSQARRGRISNLQATRYYEVFISRWQANHRHFS